MKTILKLAKIGNWKQKISENYEKKIVKWAKNLAKDVLEKIRRKLAEKILKIAKKQKKTSNKVK